MDQFTKHPNLQRGIHTRNSNPSQTQRTPNVIEETRIRCLKEVLWHCNAWCVVLRSPSRWDPPWLKKKIKEIVKTNLWTRSQMGQAQPVPSSMRKKNPTVLIYVLVVQTPLLSLESILLRMACILCLITVANSGTPSPTRPGLCQMLQLSNPLFVI